MNDGTSATRETADTEATTASPDGHGLPPSDARIGPGWKVWTAVVIALVMLAIGGGVVAYEWHQMSLVTQPCATPRTSWVPFLHANLLACIGW